MLRMVLLSLAVHALPAPAQTNLSFEAITTRDGLSDNYILSMLQDRHGFLWLGSRDGLTRYDGHAFVTFKHDIDDKLTITDGGVDCLCEDHNGNIWIGTSAGGLDRFDRVTGRFVHHWYDPDDPGSIPGNRVISIVEDRRGDLWVLCGGGRWGDGICRLDRRTGRFRRYHLDLPAVGDGLGFGLTSLLVDPAGTLWLGTSGYGVLRYDPATDGFIGYRRNPSYRSLRYLHIILLHADRLGLWSQWSDSGMVLIRHVGDSLVYGTHPLTYPHLAGEHVKTVLRDRAGRLWLGTGTGGLYVFDERTGRHFRVTHNQAVPTSLTSDAIYSIAEDRAGNLWIGTDNGVDKLTFRAWSFTHYRRDPVGDRGLSHVRARSVLKTRDGTLWVGTGGGGLDELPPGADGFRHHDLNIAGTQGRQFNIVNVLRQDSDGTLWAGTNGGLVRIDPDGRRRYFIHDQADPTSIPVGGVWEIQEGSDGSFRIGTLRGGLALMDRRSGRFRAMPSVPGGPSNDVIHCIHEDRRGRIWIGSDGGLDLHDPRTSRWQHFGRESVERGGLSDNRVWYIHEDRRGILWLATSEGGLNRFDPATGRATHYTERDGLASNMVCSILEDRHGNLWIGTNNGLSRLDARSGTFKSYGLGDGLPLSEFHFKTCFDDHGRFYFGGNGGVIAFDPDSMSREAPPAPMAVTAFKLFDREMPLDTTIGLKRTIRLDHGDNFFSIEFAALDFTNPAANRYRYRLEGVDAAWRVADGRRPVASYTNVPPGRYRFQVYGASSDGAWSPRPAELEIVIAPAIWQTLWFRIAVGLGIVLALVVGVLARIRAVRRQGELERRLIESQLRALQAQMNPHFIFNSLNSILNFITTHDGASAHKYLVKFARLMRLILQSSRHDRIPLDEELDALRLYLDLESLRHDGAFTYRIDVDGEIEPSLIDIPPMIIQPYVENGVKHGLAYRDSGGELVIGIAVVGEHLVCTVTDNGIGRRRSAELKRSGPARSGPAPFESVGMGVTADRLEILSSLHSGGIGVDVVDLLDERGEPAGTRVELRIPIG